MSYYRRIRNLLVYTWFIRMLIYRLLNFRWYLLGAWSTPLQKNQYLQDHSSSISAIWRRVAVDFKTLECFLLESVPVFALKDFPSLDRMEPIISWHDNILLSIVKLDIWYSYGMYGIRTFCFLLLPYVVNTEIVTIVTIRMVAPPPRFADGCFCVAYLLLYSTKIKRMNIIW